MSSGTIWGIDRRIVLGAAIFLVLVLPVFPRTRMVETTETIYVDVTSYQTSYQTVTKMVETTKTVQCYVGWMWSGGYYYWYYGRYYWYGGSRTVIDPTDHVIKIDYVSEGYNSWTITLYTYEGQQRVFRNVYSYDLTLSGTFTGTETKPATEEKPIITPIVRKEPREQKKLIPITERVSILQLLLGL